MLSELPSVDEIVKSLPSPTSDPLAGKLKAIHFVQATKILSVEANFGKINIIPDIMLVQNLDISVILRLGSVNKGLESLHFSADWVLRHINIRVKVSYDRAAEEVLFAAIPKEGLS